MARQRSESVRICGTPTRRGRPGKRSPPVCICGAMERLSFDPPASKTGEITASTSQIQQIPCLIDARPISPTYPGGDWRTWEIADQRFVDHRPDVLSFASEPLDQDLTVTGRLEAKIFASTSGTDSDFIVKLIDIYPENAQKARGMERRDPSLDNTRNHSTDTNCQSRWRYAADAI